MKNQILSILSDDGEHFSVRVQFARQYGAEGRFTVCRDNVSALPADVQVDALEILASAPRHGGRTDWTPKCGWCGN